MTYLAHYFWAIIPLYLWYITWKGSLKKVTKAPGKEDLPHLVTQAVLATGCWVLALCMDVYFIDILGPLLKGITFGMMEDFLIRWLLYPVILFLFGYGAAALVRAMPKRAGHKDPRIKQRSERKRKRD